MRAGDIFAHDREARLRFTYVPDGPRDTWRSHADEVLRGEAWQDDCDGLASTVLDLLGRAGLPLHRRYRLLVDTRGTDVVNHMIGCAVDDAGRFWIVGDTFGAAYEATVCRHQVIDYHRLDQQRPDGQADWRGGAPWQPG